MAPISGPSPQHPQLTYTYSHFYNRGRGLILGNTDILNPVIRLATNKQKLNSYSNNISNLYKLHNKEYSIHIEQLSPEPIATMPLKQSSLLRKPGVKSLSPLIPSFLPKSIAQYISLKASLHTPTRKSNI
jgi:hypothetical protein